MFLFRAQSSAQEIPTFHLDGAFQTASGLFRLDSGQLPSRDFFPYLGSGPLFLIYPFFKVAGGNIHASVFSAMFVCLTLGWLAVSALFHLIFRPRNIVTSIALGAFVFMAIDSIADWQAWPGVFFFWNEPGNSLRNIRSSLPYLIVISAYGLITRIRFSKKLDYNFGVLAGACLIWSNDFAIPTASFFTLYFVLLVSNRQMSRTKSCVRFFVAFIVSSAFLLSLLSMGRPISLIRYNFLDVARDQWWYFAPYSPTSRVFEINQILRIFSEEIMFPFFVLLLACLVAMKTRRTEHSFIVLIGLILFFGGCLASLGGHLGGYFDGFIYWGIATATLAALRLLYLATLKQFRTTFFKARVVLLVGALGFLMFNAKDSYSSFKEIRNQVSNDSQKFYSAELGGYLGREWKGYIDYAIQHKQLIAVEEYWGLLSSINRSRSPWQVDSAIHALGSVRSASEMSLSKTDLVVTTRFGFNPQWQPWSVSQNFWLYDDLLINWTPDYISPSTVVWRKTGEQREQKSIGCRVENNRKSFVLETEAPGFYRVEINYSASAGRYLLMVQNNISYGTDANGFISIPIKDSSQIFPVRIGRDSGSAFVLKIVGSNRASYSVNSCKANEISFENKEVLYDVSEFILSDDFYLTDANWDKGVARVWAGFFVPNTYSYKTRFQTGEYVKFVNGEVRKIIRAEEALGNYLNIYVEGPALVSQKTGIPKHFQILEKYVYKYSEKYLGPQNIGIVSD